MAAFARSAPCWVDVQLPDLEAGKRFYGELFGWTFRAGDGPYADAFSGGKLVAALAAKQDGRMPTAWGIYFATDDIVASAARIREAGGQVITEPVRAGRAGALAQAADPGGAVFGLWQAGDREGFQKQNEPVSFCWTEVYTRQKDRVDAFYEKVFGFQGTELDVSGADASGAAGPGTAESGVDFRMWSPAGTEPGPETAVGGRSVITDAFPAEMPSYFLSYFAVQDCNSTAGHAVRLGGRISAPPFDIPHGRMAVLQDDQGAVFGVLQPPVSEKGAE
ncbi:MULTISPECIES: VOC family protein [unclassified Streptomyces]|uniref:VOC family protein n=1 Tax=unclassified Streptomyces TaxID=2593676 RepID=UPI002E76CB34|nr:VOC family protein [Streptomyces sp. JV184]MEE1746707.1 VOC family protein [Streptomyces sp. JV184]